MPCFVGRGERLINLQGAVGGLRDGPGDVQRRSGPFRGGSQQYKDQYGAQDAPDEVGRNRGLGAEDAEERGEREEGQADVPEEGWQALCGLLVIRVMSHDPAISCFPVLALFVLFRHLPMLPLVRPNLQQMDMSE
jgi:hypothetical protein